MITNIIWINIHIELYSLQKICVLICVYALYICISMVIYHTHTHIYIYIHTHSFSLLVITLIILMKKLRLRDLKWFDSWYVRMWKEAIDKSVIHIIIHNPSYVCHISLPLYTQEHTYTHLTSKLLMEILRTLSSTVFLAIKKKTQWGIILLTLERKSVQEILMNVVSKCGVINTLPLILGKNLWLWSSRI